MAKAVSLRAWSKLRSGLEGRTIPQGRASGGVHLAAPTPRLRRQSPRRRSQPMVEHHAANRVSDDEIGQRDQIDDRPTGNREASGPLERGSRASRRECGLGRMTPANAAARSGRFGRSRGGQVPALDASQHLLWEGPPAPQTRRADRPGRLRICCGSQRVERWWPVAGRRAGPLCAWSVPCHSAPHHRYSIGSSRSGIRNGCSSPIQGEAPRVGSLPACPTFKTRTGESHHQELVIPSRAVSLPA